MKKLSYTEILSKRLTPIEAINSKRHPVSLLLHNIRSMYNVGSIFRTADSAFAEEIFLSGYTPTPEKIEVQKTALGSTESVKWTYFKSPIEAINYLKSKKVKIIALELTDNAINYDELILDDYPMCLVLGNELSGIDDELLLLCDKSIQIPMYGVKHSLNVSVATGIALYEAIRIWTKNL